MEGSVPCDFREIPLTKGYIAIIDQEDFELISSYTWHIHKAKNLLYARGHLRGCRKDGLIYMHRLIRPPLPTQEIDHIDGDGLNNRRKNLRICTHKNNMRNMSGFAKCTSRYKGVYYARLNRKWCAQIRIEGKRTHIGIYSNEEDAARAYNEMAAKHYGEFARLNEVA